MADKIDWFNKTAIEVHGKPADWRWIRLDAHNKPEDFIEVVGAVPIGVFSRGANKGRPKFPGISQCDRVWMRESDIDRIKRCWEQDTGKCFRCEGSGEMLVGVSSREGRLLRECVRCKGTGVKPNA